MCRPSQRSQRAWPLPYSSAGLNLQLYPSVYAMVLLITRLVPLAQWKIANRPQEGAGNR